MLILTGSEAAKKIHNAFLAEFEKAETFTKGQAVKVRLHSDENWFDGIVDNPKKQWVIIEDFYGKQFIADENCIAEIKGC